jgi:hypothetical protein
VYQYTVPSVEIQLTGTTAINGSATVAQDLTVNGDFSTSGSIASTSGSSNSFAGQVQLGAGTAAAPALSTTGDTNTGIFFPAADTIAFSEGGAEAMRIDSSGNVLVGATANSGHKFEVTATTDVARFIATDAGASGSQIDLFHDSASPANNDVTSLIGFSGRDSAAQLTTYSRISGISTNVTNGSESGAIAFSTRNTGTFAERMRLDSSGNLLVGVTTANANGGVLQLKSGITFPATAVAATDANTLDDYEEGTWTPAYQTSNNDITYSAGTNVNGKYTKVGNTVFFSLMIRGNITGGTGNLRVTGLPFAAVTVSSAGCPCVISSNYEWTSSPGTNPHVAGSLIVLGSIGATNFALTAIGASKSGSGSYNEVTLSGSYQVS